MRARTARRLIVAGIIVAVIVVIAVLRRPVWPQYEIADLGLIGVSTSGSAINNKGQVAGTHYSASSGQTIGFVWDAAGGKKDIQVPNSEYTVLLDINDKGQVVGHFSAGNKTSAFTWDAESGFSELGTLGGRLSEAKAINNKGQVVGWAKSSNNIARAFIWDEAGGMRDLGTLGGQWSRATDINNKGQVVGFSALANGQTHAFIWQQDSGMADLGSLGGPTSLAKAINNAGQVVGNSKDAKSRSFRGFVWDRNSGMTELDVQGLNVYPQQINDRGQIIGTIRKQGFLMFPDRETYFLWDAKQGVTELDDTVQSKGSRLIAADINNKGQIVGVEVSERGSRHAVILTPKPQTNAEN